MALETTTNRVEFAGNGVTTAFSFPYYFLAEADLKVIIRSSLGVETVKTLTTHYTIVGEGLEAGGTVTMLVAPAVGESLIIYRDPSILQDKDLVENDSLPAEQVEQALDRAAMVSQRLSERLDRTVGLSDGFVADFDLQLPSDLDDAGDKVPLINAAGDGWADVADWPEASDLNATVLAAAASAAAAAASETAADASADASAASAVASAASAAAAAATLASAFFRDVVFFTSASSPVTIDSTHNGKLLVFDSSGGAIAVALPTIAGVTLPFNITALCSVAGNNVTFTRGGTDVFTGGGTTKVMSVANTGFQIAADTDSAPDSWSVLEFGSVGDGTVTAAKLASNAVETAKILDANVTQAKLSAAVLDYLRPGDYRYIGSYPGSTSNYWSRASNTLGDFTVTGSIPTIAAASSGNSGITVANATSNLPGCSFTAPRTGVIRITFTAVILPGQNAAQTQWSLQMYETTTAALIGTDLGGSLATQNTVNGEWPVILTAYLSVTATTAYNIKLQGRITAGTIFIGPASSSGSGLICNLEYIA